MALHAGTRRGRDLRATRTASAPPARSAPVPPVELLPVEPERGLARLPAPSPGDVFLDLEGDPFIGDAGREYLVGWFTADSGYNHVWATSDAAERAAFEGLIDTIMARWEADPGLHIYHFATYETTAFKRLAGRYATRADELDRLLRGQRFIDLHSVTRQSLRAGVESYSIKRLEPIIGYTREISLDNAGTSHRGLRLALQRGMPEAIDPEWRSDVEVYNRDDCVSAAKLRDWLEARRAEVIVGGAVIHRPPLRDGEPEQVTEVRSAAAETAAVLLAGIPDDRKARTDIQHATWLLGHLMQWYVRELKSAWWDFFRVAALSDDERLDDAKAIAGLKLLERKVPRRGNPIDRYSFPAQDVLFRVGEALYIDAELKVGTVRAIDPGTQIIEIMRARAALDQPLTSVFGAKMVNPKPRTAHWSSSARRSSLAAFYSQRSRRLRAIERMLIVTQIGGGEELREGISSAFQDHLAACGVRAVVVHIRALDLDPDQLVRDAAHELQPSAVLTIFVHSDNGKVWFGSTEVTQEYNVRVVAARSSTVLWDSTMTWELTSKANTDWRGTGARFADSILGELRGSGLARCRTEAASVAPAASD